MKEELKTIQDQINKLNGDLQNLSGAFFKNNFSSSQTFNKDAIFSSRLRVPVFSAAPDVGEVGDIIAVGGVLYICTTPSSGGTGAVFTKVGAQ